MTKEAQIQFAKRYRAALGNHLRHRSPVGSARTLGRSAVFLGLNTLDLVRLHDRAVPALGSPRTPVDGGNGSGPPPPADRFLLEVLAPIEQTQRAARRAANGSRRLGRILLQRTRALAAARKAGRREGARRKRVEKRLRLGAQHYNDLLARSRRMQGQLRRLTHQILSAQEEERKEISRELHDEVAQILAGINVQLAALKESAAISGGSLRKRIAQTQRLVAQSVEVVHRYARELRPALLDDLGLIPALRSYMRDLPGGKGLRIRFSAYPGVEKLDNVRRTVLYRVTQEALTNVARHAHARLVTVDIRPISNAVRLEVCDDGRAFGVDRVFAAGVSKRLGLLGMRERVEMVGGKLAIDSSPGRGTKVRAEIPFRGHLRGTHV